MTELAVWLAGRRAGALVRKPNGNLQFRYASGYDGPPVSLCLPLQVDAHPHAVVRAVFGGLLPEGDVRIALAGNLGVSAKNDYALLDAVGGDVAGALTLLPEGAVPPIEGTMELLNGAQVARLLDQLPERPLAISDDEGIRLSLAGAQPKVPVIMLTDGRLALPTNSAAPTTHILKPEPKRFPGFVDNEAFCMALARACELTTASVSKGRSDTGLPYLVVERYDRDLTTEPIRRLHQEDVCQALGLPADQKYQAEGGPTFRQTSELIRRATSVPAQDLPRLLRALCLNWVIGNCDAHGKNYSLLYDQGAPTLAPLYDLVSTVIYPDLTWRLAMSIDGARNIDDVTPEAWQRLAKDAGYRPAFVRQTVEEVAGRAAEEAERMVELAEHSNATARKIRDRVVLAAASV